MNKRIAFIYFKRYQLPLFVLLVVISLCGLLFGLMFVDWIKMIEKKNTQVVSVTTEDEYKRKLQQLGVPIVAGADLTNKNPPEQRLVHLDLKGAPPKISYLKRLFPMMKILGATGLLIEYEDMFPYKAPIEHLSAKNAYSVDEVRDMLKAATWAGLSVMPLIQTFGHMEFVLKYEKYQHLRENPSSPDSICPSLAESSKLIEHMLTQVIQMHVPVEEDGLTWPMFTHIHIGCDEVYNMAKCSRCKLKNKHDLFVSHVKNITSIVHKVRSNLNVVIWDDMIRQSSLNELKNSGLGTLIQPMLWAYGNNLQNHFNNDMWMRYATVFPTVWTASSFKGAAGVTALLPPLRKYLENNLEWVALINLNSKRFKNGIQGIALTGWQRYNHFLELCELFPVSMISLALCLQVTTDGHFEPNTKKTSIFSTLSCPQQTNERWIQLNTNEINVNEYNSFRSCSFPGNKAMLFSLNLYSTFVKTRNFLIEITYNQRFLSSYEMKYSFGSPKDIEGSLNYVKELEAELNKLQSNAAEVFADVYDEYTIQEIIEQSIFTFIQALNEIKEKSKELTTFKVWPQRPINGKSNQIQQNSTT